MMIKSDTHKQLPESSNNKIFELLAIFLISIGIFNSCNYKGRDFFAPPTGFTPIEPQKLETPQLVSPENGATDVEFPIQFKWDDVENADFGYTFHLSTSNTFEDLLFDELVDNTEIEIIEDFESLFDSEHFWRVKANGGITATDPVESDWSDSWMYKTLPKDTPPPELGLQKVCIEHGDGISHIKLLWEMNFIDITTALNMVILLKFTGPGTDTILEAIPNQNLLLTHILQISSFGLYNYQISQILLNDEPIEFTGDTQGEVDVDSDELNAGECDI